MNAPETLSSPEQARRYEAPTLRQLGVIDSAAKLYFVGSETLYNTKGGPTS